MTPKSILLCEDNSVVRETLRCVLQMCDMVVFAYDSADEALTDPNINLSQFDAIISDYQMPGLKGDVFARLVRRSNPTSQIILISSNYVHSKDDKALDIEFLAKPFSCLALINKLSATRPSQDDEFHLEPSILSLPS